MTKTQWLTLGAAASLFAAAPVLASEGHQHDPSHAHQGANQEAGTHGEHAHPAVAAPSGTVKKGVRTVQVAVTDDGFVPADIHAKRGETLKLVVTRKVDKTCATEIVLKDRKISKSLPLGKPVAVKVKADKPGDIRFACGMDMIAGTIHVE